MVEKIINKAMKKSNAESFLPKFANAKKVIEEIAEHFNFLKWAGKRIILPVAVFYVLAGLFFQEHILDALFTSFLVFLYSNFLPDLDSFFSHADGKKASSVEKRLALFFAPVYIYYLLSQKIKPLSLDSSKPFHNKKALAEFSIFLFVFGAIIYFSLLKAFFLALFGFLGFLTHLMVDKQLKF